MKTARDLIRHNLKRLRTERGIPASTIAKIIGVETNHVYRIERGETTLVPENMDMICKAFNICHSYFLTDHDKDTNNKLPPELYNELVKVKDLSPEGKNSVINFIKFLHELESKNN